MAIFRKTFSQGRMNLDIENRLLPDGEYREAINAVILDNQESEEGSVRKSYSNLRLTNLDLGPNPIYLGSYSHSPRNRVYWLVLTDSGAYLIEYDFNSDTTSFALKDTRPVGERVFDLKEDFYCSAINIISHEDINKELILITDNNIEPLCFNIERAKTWGENNFSKEDIYLIKKPPTSAPQVALTHTGGLENYMEESFQLFGYRYRYLDGEYSAFSDFTNYQFAPGEFELDFQTLENLGMVNKFNAVNISFNTGGKNVTDIQIILKKTNSNTPYLIETFNKEKEQIADNTIKSFVFANEKIYTALPERELYRTFDNVPRKALAQTIIGNKVIYGNYVEGYDIKNTNQDKINVDYNLSVISREISGELLEKTITGNILAGGTEINISFDGIDIVKGTSLRFGFVMKSVYNILGIYIPKGSYDSKIDFYINENYDSISDLATDGDFIFFIEETLTNYFNANLVFETPANSVLDSSNGFTLSVSGNVLTIYAPNYTYQIDNTPANPSDSNFTNITYQWLFLSDSTIYFNNFSVSSSCKTNRSYDVGIIYMDDPKRKTTVITSKNNTIYIPQEHSIDKNSLKATIHSEAPYWATSYKFAVKHQPLRYQTIYGVKFYEDGLFRWLKIEGANLDKVKEGDTLIVKSDLGGPVKDVIKVRILEKVEKDVNFLVGNVNVDGQQIIEEHGVYIKLKPSGFDMNYTNAIARTFIGGSHERYPRRNWTLPVFGYFDDSVTYNNYKVGAGTSIHIFIQFEARGAIEYLATYDRRFVVSSEYDSIKEWFEAEVQNLGQFGLDYTWNGVNDIGPNIEAGAGSADAWNQFSGWGFHPSGSSFFVVPHRKGTASRNITTTVKFEVFFTEGLLIFETEPKPVDSDIYYECSESYNIIDGKHQGNIENQTDSIPAEVELDFFNCYTQGNGAESYQVKDSILKPYLNIDTKPTSTSIEEYQEIRRSADLTYSESFVESSNINGLNVFNLSTANFKDDLDKQYGSVQKLHSRENNIVVLQERKSGQVLFDKDAIYTADGNPALTSIAGVLGRYLPYSGNRGIGKNRESFSVDDYGRIKYASVNNGSVVRLSLDGIDDITYGLENYFRNLFISNKRAKIFSGYDPFLKLTFFNIGDEPEILPRFNCSTEIIKTNQTEEFKYDLVLNNLGGNIVFTYDITEGYATIEVEFNGNIEVVSNVTGTGTIEVERDSLIENIATITITPVSDSVSYTIMNTCPIGTELEINLIVLNDINDSAKTITNRFKKTTSSFISYLDTFTDGPVTKAESIIGTEGIGAFPSNGDVMIIQSLKDTLNSGKFEIDKCNRLAYLISNLSYGPSEYQEILDDPDTQYLSLSESGESGFLNIVSASFVFNRDSIDQKLYLIWDYTDRNPVANDDYVSTQKGTSKNIDVLANDYDTNSLPLEVTIITNPTNGTAVLETDGTITYTHDNSDTFSDTIVYSISNGICFKQATIYIDIAVACDESFSYAGNQGTFSFPISFGTNIGPCGITYDAFTIPDQFEIFYDGVLVATTAGMVSGIGNLIFEKTTALPTTAIIVVTATNAGTAWTMTGICPNVNPSGRQSFLDSEKISKGIGES